MATKESLEFKNALIDIATHAHQLDSPFGNILLIITCLFLFRKHNFLPCR